MQVIFLKDIKNVARKGETKKVSDGYALNFLLPQKMALAAGQKEINSLIVQQKRLVEKKQRSQENLEKIIEKIAHKKIVIKKQASEKNKLFAAVSAQDISLAIKNSFQIDLEPEKIKQEKHIKELGVYEIELMIGQKKVTLTLEVKK